MTRTSLTLLALALIAPGLFAQRLPAPRNPAGDQPAVEAPPQQPAPPQNGPQQAPPRDPLAGQAAQKNAEQLRAAVAALRQADTDRKQARIDRMNQFKAARAAEQQKLYQDWHERYLADAPVRVEYYRALTAAYQSQPALPYYAAPYFYGVDAPVILAPVYAPIVPRPIHYQPLSYGIVVSWGW
jgi:hypothetical protein